MQYKNIKRIALTVLIAVASVIVLSGACSAAEFSADMYQRSLGKSYTGKLYIKGTKMRQEVTLSRSRKDILIFLPDKGIVWLLDPIKKTYMRVSQRYIVGADDPTARGRMKQFGVFKKLGSAKVNGYTCTKLQWATKGGAKYLLTEWMVDKLKIPVRTEFKSPQGLIVIEYKNIKEGVVAASLFEIPKGYRRIQTPTAPKVKKP